MSRQQGFARGDFDTSFPIDERIMQLRASLAPAEYHATVGVWWHIVAAAWRKAERKPASVTCPEAADEIASLTRVGLLDDRGRMTTRSYNAWVGKALAARKASTDRKRVQRGSSSESDPSNRAGMSRGTDVGHRVTARDSRVRTGRDGTGTETGGAGGLNHTTGAIAEAWATASGKTLLGSGAFAGEYLDDASARHPEAEVVAAIRQARTTYRHVPSTQALASAVRAILDPLASGKDARAAETEQQDRARSARAVTATIAKVHGYGGHDGKPDLRCEACTSAAAPA